MPVTAYDRLFVFYQNNKVIPLTALEKPFLGRVISKKWYESQQAKEYFVTRQVSDEDTGTYKVLAYPEIFIPEIDAIINDWYFPPVKRVRNRKKIPVFTAKKPPING